MSDLFETQNEVTLDDCVKYAQNLVNSSVSPVPWQGYHSYTLLSESGSIVQFRSKASPLDISMTTLAKETHPQLAPTTTYQGLMPNSSVSIWVMEALPGVGYLYSSSSITVAKQDTTVIDMARFYAASWNNARPPAGDRHEFYHTKLMQLSSALPKRFAKIIENTDQSLHEILHHVRWVLTHPDLSDMNILVDPDSGHLTGVVDWADATIEPFGIGLWGLESVLGCSGPDGWSYYGKDISHSRKLFGETFLKEIGMSVSAETRRAIDEARILGVLVRYGFCWEDGTAEPATDTSLLDVFLSCESRR